ncbi:DUF3244 domain-containing protein [uncultured Bacteroides sp.]|uniref:DUF3244 domain-containing protein n=1 Tax=uncultured Bacteroides sp. TaxID=162156 RepID=UPI002AA6E3D0|nr:DUF3244 domain-containing protein [uncultured Bacteroides sp.]
MRSSFISCIVGLCSFLFIGVVKVYSNPLTNEARISLFGNDIPFEDPIGSGQETRSIPLIPISAFLNENHFVKLEFYKPVGEIEIVISQNGTIVYSVIENIISPILKSVELLQGLSGEFLLEIRVDNEAYVYGWFTI